MLTGSLLRASLIGALITAALLAQAVLITRLNVNWDEYWFLGRIYAANAGILKEPLQNFHVHLLAWVPGIPLGPVDQVIVGRMFMLACELVSLIALYLICRRFSDRQSALMVVVLWFGSTFSIAYGASFRTDPLAAALLMTALAMLLFARHRWQEVLAGSCAALALLVTIKSAIFLPAFLGVFALHWRHEGFRAACLRFAVAGTALLVVGGALWLWHSGVLLSATTARHATTASLALSHGADETGRAAQKVIVEQGWFPRWRYILAWMLGGIVTALAIAFGAFLALRDLSQARRQDAAILAIGCLLPAVSLALYRNAYPYFFPFLMLPAVAGALPAMQWLAARRRLLRELLLVGIAGSIAIQIAAYWPRDQVAQRAYTEQAIRLFPEPVPYIERSAMLPMFRKSGFLMSTWGIEGSHDNQQAPLVAAIGRDAPPLLLVSSPALRKALYPASAYSGPRLRREDEEILRSNYIQHWGDLWVAGKRIDSKSGQFQIVIPGVYTLECHGDRSVDSRSLGCGESLFLQKGEHRWSGGSAVLRWGKNLPTPPGPPPEGPIYYRF